VDAYPTEEFTGSVTQVRLQPQTVQNVVTYSTVIDVPNPELKLKPGMTANVNIEIARRNNVLRVPNAALRFRPTAEIFQALGQTPPPGGIGGGGGGRGGRRGGAGGAAPSGTDSSLQPSPSQPVPNSAANVASKAPARAPVRQGSAAAPATDGTRQARRNADQTAAADAAPGNDAAATPGRGGAGGRGGRGNFQERMANMTPEERQQFIERMRARGFDPEAVIAGRGGAAPASSSEPGSGRGAGAGATAGKGWQGATAGDARASGRRSQSQTAPQPVDALRTSSATTIDALFGPLPPTESFGQVWVSQNGKLARLPLRVGITDGQQTELIQGDVKEGEDVVTSVVTAAQRATTNAGSTAFPGFQQNRGGGGFGGGGFGGGAGGPRGGGGR
jgi:hypothetical protein